jgi:hypothetical protein
MPALRSRSVNWATPLRDLGIPATIAFLDESDAAGPVAHATPTPDRDQPVPTPPAPAPSAFAAGFGGSLFVPLAMLTALVALSMSPLLRRLREAPVIPAPNPFICALECPG